MQVKPFITPSQQWVEQYRERTKLDELTALYHLLDEIRRDVQSLRNAQRQDE